jgi:hypothetical protein
VTEGSKYSNYILNELKWVTPEMVQL